MTKVLSVFLFFFILCLPSSTSAQEVSFLLNLPSLSPSPPSLGLGTPSLSVPLLAGSPAPFDGLLINEAAATQCIDDAAAVGHLTVELAARARELEISTRLREEFERAQAERITALSQHSWWDENGNVFMLGVGLVLGVAASALVAGLVN